MITFQRVTKLVRNHIAHQLTRQEQQFAIQAHATVRRATAPAGSLIHAPRRADDDWRFKSAEELGEIHGFGFT
jgi:hypothetical protein